MTRILTLSNCTKQISSIVLGVVLAITFFILFPVLLQGATFLGGYDSEALIEVSGSDDSSFLISAGSDASMVIETSPYISDSGWVDMLGPGETLPDMAGETGQPGWTEEFSSLSSHPFYPLVDMIADQTGIPEQQVWVIGATFIIMMATIAGFMYAPHQMITASIGTLLTISFWVQGIFPFWVIFIYILCAVAIILYERVPSL